MYFTVSPCPLLQGETEAQGAQSLIHAPHFGPAAVRRASPTCPEVFQPGQRLTDGDGLSLDDTLIPPISATSRAGFTDANLRPEERGSVSPDDPVPQMHRTAVGGRSQPRSPVSPASHPGTPAPGVCTRAHSEVVHIKCAQRSLVSTRGWVLWQPTPCHSERLGAVSEEFHPTSLQPTRPGFLLESTWDRKWRGSLHPRLRTELAGLRVDIKGAGSAPGLEVG